MWISRQGNSKDGVSRLNSYISSTSPFSLVHSPSEHKKTLFFQEQESGNRESLETQVRFDFSLTTPEFAKNPMLYEVHILCYYRENTKWNQ